MSYTVQVIIATGSYYNIVQCNFGSNENVSHKSLAGLFPGLQCYKFFHQLSNSCGPANYTLILRSCAFASEHVTAL